MKVTTEELKQWKPSEITKEQFEWLCSEHSAGMAWESMADAFSEKDYTRLNLLEDLIDKAPWSIDEDGVIFRED